MAELAVRRGRLDRRQRRHVPDHRQRAVFRMQREGDLPVHRHLPHRRVLAPPPATRRRCRRQRACACTAGSYGSRKTFKLRLVEIAARPAPRRRLLDAVGVVQHHAEIADAADAGFRTHGRQAGLDAREAEGALLRFAGRPVVVDLLVGTAGDAHAPAAALVLVDQDDAVFLALVDRAGRAGGDAGRVQAVLAQPRQIHHEGVFELAVDFLLHAFEVAVLRALGELAAEDFLPVRPPLDLLHPLAADQRARACRRHRLASPARSADARSRR